jgi:uncharacterized membrane protein
MFRTLLWLLGGVLLGAVIHIVVILTLPGLAATSAWDRVAALGAGDKPVVLPQIAAGTPNPLRLDPELTYAACQLDLAKGAGIVSGTLPAAFWSVSVYDKAGTVLYSTTSRDGAGQVLDVGLFDASQTRLLAEQKLDVAEGLLIVEAPEDNVMVVVRLAPPQPAMRARYEQALSSLTCINLKG